MIEMAFKDRLKKLRGYKGITQEELAKALDVPESTIRRYESEVEGYPKIERLKVIADYFGCSIDYLVERTNDPKMYYSDSAIEFIESLDLSDEDILKSFNFKFEGIPLSQEETREFIAIARAIFATRKALK